MILIRSLDSYQCRVKKRRDSKFLHIMVMKSKDIINPETSDHLSMKQRSGLGD